MSATIKHNPAFSQMEAPENESGFNILKGGQGYEKDISFIGSVDYVQVYNPCLTILRHGTDMCH